MRRSRILALLAVVGLSASCSAEEPPPRQDATTASTTSTTSTPEPGPTTTGASADPPAAGGDVALEVVDVATGLDTVWSLAFDRGGKLWFTERGGRLQQVGGSARNIPDVLEQGEGGLMGLAFDERDRIHLMLTTATDNRIVRLAGPRAEPEVLVAGIRKAGIHNGGRLAFGPDGTLYAGTGDAGDTSLPQRPSDLNGKILAVDTDAKRATVFSIGHRNPQGLCFDRGGRFLSTEHGPDRGDEVNVIEKGRNYGWPDDVGDGIRNYTPTLAVTGCAVYEADAIPQWKGSLLFTTLKAEDLRRLTFGPDGAVTDEEILYDGQFGRLRDVAVGPDGYVYLATSNKDTRGDPRGGDDRIVRIAPRGAPRP